MAFHAFSVACAHFLWLTKGWLPTDFPFGQIRSAGRWHVYYKPPFRGWPLVPWGCFGGVTLRTFATDRALKNKQLNVNLLLSSLLATSGRGKRPVTGGDVF